MNDFYSSLPRAMSLSIGHVIIIDNASDEQYLLERTLRLYEIYLAILKRVINYKVDIYEYKENKKFKGILDGIKNDTHQYALSHTFLQKIKKIDINSSTCDDQMDKKYVMNIIEDKNKFNLTIQGFLISLSLNHLITHHSNEIDDYLEIIKESYITDSFLEKMNNDSHDNHDNYDNDKILDSMIKVLDNLPRGLKKLIINGYPFKKFKFKVNLSKYSELNTLCLQKCDIDNDDLIHIIEIIENNININILDLSYNKFNEIGLKKFINNFIKLNKTNITNFTFYDVDYNIEINPLLLKLNKKFRNIQINSKHYKTPQVIFLFIFNFNYKLH